MSNQPCDACGTTTAPRQHTNIVWLAVVVCDDPAACRQRAQAAGTWCTYTPEATR